MNPLLHNFGLKKISPIYTWSLKLLTKNYKLKRRRCNDKNESLGLFDEHHQ